MPAWNLEGRRVGAVCLLCASFSFSVNDVCFKYLSSTLALHQVVFLRSLVALAITIAIIVPLAGGWNTLRSRRPALLVLRGVCVVVANFAFFSALSVIPLADATAVFFVAPLLTTAFSALFLRERVGIRRWLALGAGMLGVMFVVRPGGVGFQWPLLLPLVAAVAYATLHTITRKTGLSENAPAMALYMHLSFLAASSAAGLWLGDGRFANNVPEAFEYFARSWRWPDFAAVPVLLLTGMANASGAYFLSQAYRLEEASLLAPLEYVMLVLAVMWGFLIFGDVPTYLSAIGIVLILGSGVFVSVREAQVRRGRGVGHLFRRS